jgi:flagellar hook-length control protein FliK
VLSKASQTTTGTTLQAKSRLSQSASSAGASAANPSDTNDTASPTRTATAATASADGSDSTTASEASATASVSTADLTGGQSANANGPVAGLGGQAELVAAAGHQPISTRQSATAAVSQLAADPSAPSSEAEVQTENSDPASVSLAIDVAAQKTAPLSVGQQTSTAGADSTPASKASTTSDQQTVGKDAAAQDQASLGVASTAGSNSHAAPQVNSSHAAANTAADSLQRSQELVDRVTNSLRTSFDTGGEMRVRLEPPELGRVQVEVSAGNGEVTARLEVQTPSARQTLLDNISMLHDAIAQTGATVNRIDVVVVPPSRDDSGSERQPSSGGQQQNSSQEDSQGGSGNQPKGQQQNPTWRRSPSIDQLDIEV